MFFGVQLCILQLLFFSGRVARAGKSGKAFSLVAPDELAYMVDLFLFLNTPIKLAKEGEEYKDSVPVLGRFPEALVHLEDEFIKNAHEQALEIVSGV